MKARVLCFFMNIFFKTLLFIGALLGSNFITQAQIQVLDSLYLGELDSNQVYFEGDTYLYDGQIAMFENSLKRTTVFDLNGQAQLTFERTNFSFQGMSLFKHILEALKLQLSSSGNSHALCLIDQSATLFKAQNKWMICNNNCISFEFDSNGKFIKWNKASSLLKPYIFKYNFAYKSGNNAVLEPVSKSFILTSGIDGDSTFQAKPFALYTKNSKGKLCFKSLIGEYPSEYKSISAHSWQARHLFTTYASLENQTLYVSHQFGKAIQKVNLNTGDISYIEYELNSLPDSAKVFINKKLSYANREEKFKNHRMYSTIYVNPSNGNILRGVKPVNSNLTSIQVIDKSGKLLNEYSWPYQFMKIIGEDKVKGAYWISAGYVKRAKDGKYYNLVLRCRL